MALVVACGGFSIAVAFWLLQLPVLPRLVDQCFSVESPRTSAPIVVVGVLQADALVARPVPMHSDPKTRLQLRRLVVRVENILKGGPLPAAINVYYFTWDGGFNGPRPLGMWDLGGRRIFWLTRDSGNLRTACDGWDYCTEGVESGSHSNYRADPMKPLDYALVDIHLTRGEGPVNDRRFADQLWFGAPDGGLQGYAVQKLRELALTERGGIRDTVCKLLWIYSADRIAQDVRDQAGRALKDADCRCSEGPRGEAVCLSSSNRNQP